MALSVPIGLEATKVSPTEYYSISGKLLKAKSSMPTLEPSAEVQKLASDLRSKEVDTYFLKCAQLGIEMDTAVNGLLSRYGKGRPCTFNDLDKNPYITLARCMV